MVIELESRLYRQSGEDDESKEFSGDRTLT